MKYFLWLLATGAVLCDYEVRDVKEKEVNYWMDSMQKELKNALNIEKNTKIAKNVIIFVGDGMGITASTTGRIYKGQQNGFSGEENSLVWENFPNSALIKTYNLDRQVPDSAATATAFFTGSKANFYTVGCSPDVTMLDFQAGLDEKNWVQSILEWSQKADKETGLVTTTRISHATPSALYAHTSYRFWECDTEMNETVRNSGTKDISKQLVENEPGTNIKVILGGGRSYMGAPKETDEDLACVRTDGINLVEEWEKDKASRGFSSKYATTTEELLAIPTDTTDFIMGLFDENHTPFEVFRDKSDQGSPSIKQMTEVAIKRLRRNDNGFFLMVEGGRIDSALHMSKPKIAMEEISAFDDAVSAALDLVDIEDTLIIVCADHSHVMTFNGYPTRGHDILGTITSDFTEDKLPYPTLMFTVGPGYDGTFEYNGTNVVRSDITNKDTTSPEWVSPSIVKTTDNYNAAHGGEDIGMYAIGPMSHLFHKVHEQAYIAHVMSYASCVGPYAEDCGRDTREATKPRSKYLRPPTRR